MTNQEHQLSLTPKKSHLDFVFLTIGLVGLIWLTSRMPLPGRSIIFASVLPGPLIALAGISFGRNSLPATQKRDIILGLCVLSLGIACTVVGITRFPEHLPSVSASGIAAVGLYLVWFVRRIGKTGARAAA